jgi:hypothetical protein
MKKTFVYLASLLFLPSAYAAIDLTDFDDNVMHDIEDAAKELDSSIANRDADVAISNANFVRDNLKWTEGYFSKKGNIEDAVRFAQQGQQHALDISKAIAAKDFDAAYDSFGSLKKTCKSCHDAYKPPSL